MKHAPESFSGTWLDLYDEYVQPNLISVDIVVRLHEWLKQYCREAEAQFPVRYVVGTERRQQYFTDDRTCIVPCDNSPAWELHALLLRGEIDSYSAFKLCVPALPRHFHDVASHATINRYGWYVAHIFPAKNGDTKYLEWRRSEVERRFLTAIHPCNLFFVPKVRGRDCGEDSRVISFFADQYSRRYGAVWVDFLRCLHVRPLPVVPEFGQQLVNLDAKPYVGLDTNYPTVMVVSPSGGFDHTPKTSYAATRLLFRKSEIEAIGWEQSFEVRTPVGTFRMTKREFYTDFSNVVASTSYAKQGIYHYATLPKKAERFRIK